MRIFGDCVLRDNPGFNKSERVRSVESQHIIVRGLGQRKMQSTAVIKVWEIAVRRVRKVLCSSTTQHADSMVHTVEYFTVLLGVATVLYLHCTD